MLSDDGLIAVVLNNIFASSINSMRFMLIWFCFAQGESNLEQK